MLDLPSADVLAEIVSRVTQTMFGMSFALNEHGGGNYEFAGEWRTVVLPIPGERPLSVAIAADAPSGRMLASAMFTCPPEEVDNAMVEDSLCELVNIVAGQIKSVLGIEDALGLPEMLAPGCVLGDSTTWRSAVIKSPRQELVVWVAISQRC